ncbi:MAG TPA: CPBP family glutamic-type intramembrane protease [Gemmatimonadaceae bacterium]|nr:CPBP family glutamic-type intramembrane protease [Gemmatimonadaceae bacterium]
MTDMPARERRSSGSALPGTAQDGRGELFSRESGIASMDPNSRDALDRRREAGTLTWRGPALMLFARAALAVGAQAVAAAALLLGASPNPWHDAEPWFPVYATLIDAGCLTLLWRFTRREGIGLFDLVGFERSRLVRDVLLGLALIPASLVFIFGGTYAAGWIVYGAVQQPYFLGGLPLWASLYGVLVFPFLWGLTEQMTYNGYLLPRFQVLSRSTSVAVAVVTFVWAMQHSFMPLTFDAKFMEYRLLASIPNALFDTLLYLRLRRVVPFAVAHALMDGATVLIPLLRG